MSAEQREILRVFSTEAVERLDELEGLLGEIEDAPENRTLIDQFMRAAHTLKGSAGVAGVADVETVAHVVESVVEQLRERRLSPTPDVFDRLSKVLDAISRALPAIRVGRRPEADLLEMGESLRGWLDDALGKRPEVIERRTSEEGFSLGEYDRVRIAVLEEQGKALFVVEVRAPADVEDGPNWASAALAGLRTMGVSVATHPEDAALAGIEPNHKLSILFASEEQAGGIEEALGERLRTSVRVRAYHARAAQPVNAAAEQVSSAVVSDRTVRVDLAVLDDLLRMVGELMINRDRYRQVSKELSEVLRDTGLGAEIDDSASQLGQLTGELQDAIMRARMVPAARLFRAIKRSTRRATREAGNQFQIRTEGDEIELDKNLVDSLAGPLGDFVARIGRETVGEGGATIHAARQWNHVVLKIDSTHPASEEQNDMLRAAVVRTGGTVEAGNISVDGHSFALCLPLTLAIIRVMMTAVGGEVYAFPLESVKETLRLRSADIVSVKGSRLMEIRGRALSLVFLDEVFGVRKDSTDHRKRVLVLNEGEQPIGVVVDRLLGIREVVIKPLSKRFSSIRELRGSAILGDDQIAFILDAEVFVQEAIARMASASAGAGRAGAERTEWSAT